MADSDLLKLPPGLKSDGVPVEGNPFSNQETHTKSGRKLRETLRTSCTSCKSTSYRALAWRQKNLTPGL